MRVIEMIREELPEAEVTPATRLADLRWNHIGPLVLARLEELDIRIGAGVLGRMHTVGDLARAAAGRL